ncbi:MAG: hypothetical protein PWP51_2916 [Clostridiales bacterium]|jgi:hypothetical protein|uniref:DUF2442 domain-containing protein n=1 Tax=Fusibacter paucivorans TaxID=76009 RepID=A0ABS5PJT0_9FIRM|nr:DUF2442 domain-containing protein [Fusibacter paucivorans]MBS7525236.1 DUF2442 domain-containing protein [Fusibacter paucivorans]MDN5300363.1 hypothetical protein [Clostridiales bacterium]
MVKILEVHPKAKHQLEVLLDNGSSITLNLAPKLQTIRFGLLSDETFFRRVETDGTVIHWDHKVEISLSEVLSLLKK